MGKAEVSTVAVSQPFLPGFEPARDPVSGRTRLRRRTARRGVPRPPSIDKLVSGTAPRVRKLFSTLRSELLAATGLAETVAYDDLAGAFSPAYVIGRQELLRLTLDPVLAATLTLERGDRELGMLLASPRLPDPLKARTLQSARRSGRRVFVALLVRNADEMSALVSLVRERVALSAH